VQPIFVVVHINGKYIAAFTSHELALESLRLSYCGTGHVKKGHGTDVYVTPYNEVFRIIDTTLYNRVEHL
jgi:hypothetical protein